MPFTKGDPKINREGRPKGSGLSITTAIKKELEKKPKGSNVSYLELLVKRIIKKGVVDGDGRIIKQIWNYIDGMPKQTIENLNNTELEQALDIIKNGITKPNKTVSDRQPTSDIDTDTTENI